MQENIKKLFKNTSTVAINVVVCCLLVVGVAWAATTISTNIETGGTLDVTGLSTFSRATSTSATSTDYLYIGSDGTEDHFDFQGGDLYVRNDAEIDGALYTTGASTFTGLATFDKATSTSATSTAYLYIGPDFTEDGGMNFSGGDLFVSNDAEINGDLFMGKGIDMIGSATTTGIFLGGTYDTAAITINGTGINGRALRIGSKNLDGTSSDGSLPITAPSGTAVDTEPVNNYLFGLFSKVATTAATSDDELRGAWIRTRVNADMDIGSSANWGYGVSGAEVQLKFYGGSSGGTDTYAWQNSALWAQLETQGATTTFKDGSVASAVLANVGLTPTTVINDGAVVAGVSINSNTTDSNVTIDSGGGFYGLYIYQDNSALKDFATGIHIDGGAVDKILQAGTSSAKVTIATADTNFVQIYAENSSATGDNRGIYNRLYLTGTAGTGGGESLRSYTDLTGGTVATAHGAHISLGMGESTTGGAVTGLGVGVRSTLGLPNVALASGGTYAAMMAEIYSFGASADPSAVTELSFIRFVNDGDTTADDKVDAKAFLFSLQGFDEGATDMIYDAEDATVINPGGSIRIKINGNTRYLYYYDAAVTP